MSNKEQGSENKVIKFKSSDNNRKKIKLAIIIVAVVLVIVALFVFADNINTDRLAKSLTYFSTAREDDGSISDISISSDARNSFGVLDGCFAIADAGGLKLYSINGEQVFSHSELMDTPVVKTGNTLGIVYDIGGNTVLVFNKEGVLKTIETDYPVIDAVISGDWITLTTEESGYKALVTVYGPDVTPRYMFYSADAYIVTASASPDGHSVTAVSMKIDGSEFVTELLTYELDSEELYSSYKLKDQVALYMEYISDTQMCVICEDGTAFVNEDGSGDFYDYSYGYLGGFDVSSNGNAALVLNKNSVGTRCSVAVLSPDGVVLGSIDSNEELLSVSFAGEHVGVLTSGQLNIYDSNMSPRLSVSDIAGAKKVFMQKDGSAYIVFNDNVKLYIP